LQGVEWEGISQGLLLVFFDLFETSVDGGEDLFGDGFGESGQLAVKGRSGWRGKGKLTRRGGKLWKHLVAIVGERDRGFFRCAFNRTFVKVEC
jgi:hypothetical protein